MIMLPAFTLPTTVEFKSSTFIPSTCVSTQWEKTLSTSTASEKRHRQNEFLVRGIPRRELKAKLTEDVTSGVDGRSEIDEATLESFSSSIKGEWVGYEGEFNCETGEVSTVPDYYIPEQFNEWNLEPKGFESNHSLIVRNTILYCKFFRILPTVSLFGDHVDLEEEFKKISIDSKDMKIFKDGSFINGPSEIETKRTSKLSKWPSVQFCIRYKKQNCHIWISFDYETKKFKNNIRIIVEHFSCEYCDGADIAGSSGFVEGWPSKPAGNPSMLQGQWSTDNAIILRGDEINYDETPAALFLPNGINCSIRNADDNSVIVEVGWLVEEDVRLVARRCFDDQGVSQYSTIITETRDE